MKIESKQQLKEVIQLCRKLGVQSIKVDNIEFHLGDLPRPVVRAKKSVVAPELQTKGIPLPNEITENAKIINEIAAIDSDELTEDELLYYSARAEAFEQPEKAL